MTPGVHAGLADVQGVSGAKIDGTVVATGPQFYARVGCSARCDGITYISGSCDRSVRSLPRDVEFSTSIPAGYCT